MREGFHEEGQAGAQGLQQLFRHNNISADAMMVAPLRSMARQLNGPWHIALQVVQVGGVIHVAQKGSDAICFNIMQAVQQVACKSLQHVTTRVLQVPALPNPVEHCIATVCLALHNRNLMKYCVSNTKFS